MISAVATWARDEAKQGAKDAKASPDGVTLFAAAKAADGLRVLEAARAPLAEQLVWMGVRLPDRRAGRSRGRPAS